MALGLACGLYAASLLAFWGGSALAPAEFWPIHLLLYGPRWLIPLPALLLGPGAVWLRSRRSALALGAALVGFAGVWGFNVPWVRFWPGGATEGLTLRVLTCNVQRDDLRAGELADLIRAKLPDLVLLQECDLTDPATVLGREGWHVQSTSEFLLASRHPIASFAVLRRPDKAYRVIAVRAEIVRDGTTIPVVGVHLMTPRKGLEPTLRAPLGGLSAFRAVTAIQSYESELLRKWVEGFPGSILLAGDFNLTAEHPLYRRDWSGYADAFARTGWGLGPTMLTRHIGLRIDHVLCGPDWRPTRCWVGPDIGSAHRPVVADLAWRGRPPG